MKPDSEIRRLLDVMPASGRMLTKIVSRPEQSLVIDAPFPLPWAQDRIISINLDLWCRLSQPQRDLLILRTVSWLTAIKWFKPDLYQGVVVAGALGAGVELMQGDALGVIIASSLSGLALQQIWRKTRSSQSQLDADEAAIKVAIRRGYTEAEAAGYLLSAIETVAKTEGRLSLNFTELIRSQNLRSIAGFSPLGVPETIKNE